MSQGDLFRSQAVYKWPCSGPGDKTHAEDRIAYRFWRTRSAPHLSASWVIEMEDHSQVGAFEDERIRLYWTHPSPITRADNENERYLAVSINPESCAWIVQFIPIVGVTGWPWSRGKSDSIEGAKKDSLSRLMRLAGYHLHPEALAVL